MANSILGGATYEHGGSFTTGDGTQSSVIVKIGTGDNPPEVKEGWVVQQVNASISLQNRTVYEIGSNKYYYVMGRPSGQGSIQHLVGPNKISLWRSLGQWASCEPVSISVESKSFGKCGGHSLPEGPLKFTGGFLNSIQVGATAGDIVITSNLGFTFMDAQGPS